MTHCLKAGESADLTCSFNLGGDRLYSVKWYKGRHEFYRFMPNEVPKVKIFPVKGMKINVSMHKKLMIPIHTYHFSAEMERARPKKNQTYTIMHGATSLEKKENRISH